MAEKKYFEIVAESVITSNVVRGINQIIMFNPTPETRVRINELQKEENMGPIRITDKFDDGSDDVHVLERDSWFLAHLTSGDLRKTNTITILTKDLFAFK